MEEDFPSIVPDKRQTIDLFKETLISGEHFIKHHRFGSPKLRFIDLDPETNKLFWRDPNGRETYKGYINFAVIFLKNARKNYYRS
jgi:hypothetical protein